MEQLTQSAVLVSIAPGTDRLPDTEISLEELKRLLETAGGTCFATLIQVKDSFDPRTCIGSGKVEELRTLCENNGITLVVFDFELSPSQIRNLEEDLGGGVEVIDRSMLILDIFALHAKSGEGKLQVELAQLKYTAPRLIGKGKELSRLEGRIGTRGPGESKLESDRRHLKSRVYALQRQLEELEAKRAVMRTARDRSAIPKVAIVGYTNSGKSTLLNRLTEAGVLAENKLFATLDATTRRLELPGGSAVLLTDTVGFIRNLPHHLVRAFKSTLDEVTYSDILLIVADLSDPEMENQLSVTLQVLAELHAADKPIIYAYNKCDRAPELPASLHSRPHEVFISAATGFGIESLVQAIEEITSARKSRVRLRFPYAEQSRLQLLYGSATIEELHYEDDAIVVEAVLDERLRGQLRPYVQS
ncbi:MAG: GTPase HflX [Eubacteriales bacterium]